MNPKFQIRTPGEFNRAAHDFSMVTASLVSIHRATISASDGIRATAARISSGWTGFSFPPTDALARARIRKQHSMRQGIDSALAKYEPLIVGLGMAQPQVFGPARAKTGEAGALLLKPTKPALIEMRERPRCLARRFECGR